MLYQAQLCCRLSLTVQFRQRMFSKPTIREISTRLQSQKQAASPSSHKQALPPAIKPRNLLPKTPRTPPLAATSVPPSRLTKTDPWTNLPVEAQTDTTRLNPPLSTLPPRLEVPEWDDTLPQYKSYYRLGKAYLSFYKRGFTQIKQNYHHARSLRPPGRIKWYSPLRNLRTALTNNDLSRAQYHLLFRLRSDLAKLPLFGLVFLVCGEFTPLLVPFLTPVVPRTLWLPAQVEKERKKQQERLPLEARTEGVKLAHFTEAKRAGCLKYEIGHREAYSWEQIWVAGARMKAWSRVLDPLAKKVLPSEWLLRWTELKADELRLDDWAIERDGGVKGLNKTELSIAVERRGVDGKGKAESEMRVILQHCIDENRGSWCEEMERWLRLEKLGQKWHESRESGSGVDTGTAQHGRGPTSSEG